MNHDAFEVDDDDKFGRLNFIQGSKGEKMNVPELKWKIGPCTFDRRKN